MVSPRQLRAFVALAMCASCQPQTAGLSNADQQAIRAAVDSYSQRLQRADYAGVAALYATDAHMMPPFMPAVVGRDAILKWLNALPFSIRSFGLSVGEIYGQGDVAYVRGRYTITGTPPGAKTATADTGKFLEARRRQPDGSWPIVEDIWNTDKPPPH